MSLDTRGRSAADEMHRSTRSGLEVVTMLQSLRRSARRRIVPRLAVGVALAAVVAGVLALGWSSWHPRASEPVVTPTGSPQPSSVPTRTSLALSEPATVDLPVGWKHETVADLAVLTSPDGFFVEMLLGPAPVAAQGHPVPSPLTVQSLTTWLSTHPGLVPSSPVATSVGGLPARQVDLRQKPGPATGVTCEGPNAGCVPLVRMPSVRLPLGVAAGPGGRAYVLTLPSGRLAVVAVGGPSDRQLYELMSAVTPVLDSLVLDQP
jgi:hypothetical protein